jgi:hypothetical protein
VRHPSDFYLSLQDHGDGTAALVPAGRRHAALCFAVLLLVAAPLLWFSSDAVATSGPKAALSQDPDDDDNSGPGGGDTDGDTDGTGNTGTQTRSDTATNTGDTGVSTKQPTQTNSNTATRTGKTGASTQDAF